MEKKYAPIDIKTIQHCYFNLFDIYILKSNLVGIMLGGMPLKSVECSSRGPKR